MYQVSPDVLERMSKSEILALARTGRIRIMSDENIGKGPEPQLDDFAEFAGQTIHISAAAREFEIAQPTLSGWARRGILRVVGHEKNRKLLDRQQVAYIVALYRWHGGKSGSRLFDTGRLRQREQEPPEDRPKRPE